MGVTGMNGDSSILVTGSCVRLCHDEHSEISICDVY